MVLGAFLSLASALPTGWMFGYGYGHGVRSGYNAYRPSKNARTNELHKSLNPITGSQGAGMLSAEEMVASKALSSGTGLAPPDMGVPHVTQPTPTKKPKWVAPDLIYNKNRTYSIKREDQHKMSYTEWKKWFNGNFNWYKRFNRSGFKYK